MILSKVIAESVRQAGQQLVGNKLRTFLSLLGISIGIFCIIGVLSAVSSLQDNVQGSLSKLGDDVVYIDKWPWKDNSGNWWEYFQRPYPDHEDYLALKDKLRTAQTVGYWTVPGTKTLKYNSVAVEGGFLFVTTSELDRILSVEVAEGRFWSTAEYNSGADKILLGQMLADELFQGLNPIGKVVRMAGRKFEVIGVLAPAGDEIINPLDFDDAIMVAFPNASRFLNLKNRDRFGGTVAVKTRPGVEMLQLQDDIRGVLRAKRGLRPREDDNFALNELSMTAEALGSFFGVLNLIGFIIGGFSILVGGISVANIMFVSVKERTSLIGVKKALGARQYIILLEFLTEAVILCLIGGLMGLLLVWAITTAISAAIPFKIYLNLTYAITGVLLSAVIGVLAGIIPATLAAKMDPVEAMRN